MAPQYKLTYFHSRGGAEPVRFLFAYTGTPYEDIRISSENWPKEKSKFEWGQLPVLEVYGKPLSQSNAILRYLGNKFNLAGENEFESAKCDEHVEAMMDLRKAALSVLFEKDETKKAESTVVLKNETIPKFMTQWSKVVKMNGGFLVGKKFSYADFSIATNLDDFNSALGGTVFDNFPVMKSHLDSVFSAKGIKQWVEKRPKSQH